MPDQTFEPKSEVTSISNSDSPVTPTHAISESPARPKSRWWMGILLLIVLAVGGLLYYQRQSTGGSSRAKAAAPPRPVPVGTAPARKGDIGVYVEALGTVTPVYTVTVTSRVQGQIMQVYYKEGQIVRKGDPLLDIDPRPYQAALTQAQGQLAHDSAMLAEARTDLDRYRTAFS